MAQAVSREEVMAYLSDVLVRKYGVAPGKIVAGAGICEDLKLNGDDAAAFFDSFHDQFPFDAAGFRYDDYFSPEGFSLGIVGRLLGRR